MVEDLGILLKLHLLGDQDFVLLAGSDERGMRSGLLASQFDGSAEALLGQLGRHGCEDAEG